MGTGTNEHQTCELGGRGPGGRDEIFHRARVPVDPILAVAHQSHIVFLRSLQRSTSLTSVSGDISGHVDTWTRGHVDTCLDGRRTSN